MFLPAIFHQNCQAVLAVVSINGLNTTLYAMQVTPATPNPMALTISISNSKVITLPYLNHACHNAIDYYIKYYPGL